MDDLSDLSDLFGGFGGLGDIFGRSTRATTASRKGQNITATVNLSFKDALNGITTRINVPVERAGTVGGRVRRLARRRGLVRSVGGVGYGSGPGVLCFLGAVREVWWEGTIVEKPCRTCSGSGRVREARQVTVRIPAGAKDGMKIGFRGGAAPARGVVLRGTCTW